MAKKLTFTVVIAGAMLGGWSAAEAPAATLVRSNTAQPLIAAAGDLFVPGAKTLTRVGTAFSPYTGSITLSYHARTSAAGSATITMQATSDFTGSHPSVGAGDLTYNCGPADLGTACSGTQTASTTTSQAVVSIPPSSCTGGGGGCSSAVPNSMIINFWLANSPAAQTGTYTSNIVFTISAN